MSKKWISIAFALHRQETEELLRKEAKVGADVKVEETSENESDVSQALAAYKRYFRRQGRRYLIDACYFVLLNSHRCDKSKKAKNYSYYFGVCDALKGGAFSFKAAWPP